MNKPIITIRDLGKSYRNRNHPEGELWALRNVSMDIYKGEVWGVIGRNGAGKSTLLKLLSKVTRQTEGEFQIHGKVHSILELGMGFHVELTGLDNLLVAGSLQGMSRQEIRDRLQDIIEFSGLGEAVYQPLRTYSSGMRVRLAFALAAFTSPDILILDEILAVGDEAFQRKCFEVIRTFLKQGVTVLFVSHDMKLISLICNKCMLLHNGQILDTGTTEVVIESYAKIMGPGIEKNDIALTFAGRYVQLFHKNFRITRRYGLYTAVRANRVWYDPAYILWDDDFVSDNLMVLNGHYITLPLSTKWIFKFTDDDEVVWQVYFKASPGTFIERFQVNVMLNYHFREWCAEDVNAMFPEQFVWQTGEDWTRHWIGNARSVISASAANDRFTGQVQLTSLNTSGVLAVISSSPEYRVRMLQYLKTWAVNESVQAGEYLFFDGRIRILSGR